LRPVVPVVPPSRGFPGGRPGPAADRGGRRAV